MIFSMLSVILSAFVSLFLASAMLAEERTKAPARMLKAQYTPSPSAKPGTRPVSRAARMLALAHYVERLVDEGTVSSYADAARQLGVSRARMAQITNLLNLAPRVQEGLLLGDLHLSERRIRALVAGVEWEEQQDCAARGSVHD